MDRVMDRMDGADRVNILLVDDQPGKLLAYETILAEFGPDRLMFGSDWPVCTLTASYGDVVAAARTLTAGLSAIERAAVFGGTARRVYRLG